MYTIDLNSDMGESFGAYRIGNDEGIIQHITSTNVACGYHAGGPMVMDKVVRMAKEWGVAVGAHPGYPDLMGFGRRKMTLSVDEVKNYMQYQIGALMAFTQSYGLKLQHVAPHGALGNLCQYDRETSRAICEAVYEIDPSASSTARGPSWGGSPEDGSENGGGDLCRPRLYGGPVPGPLEAVRCHDHR